MPHRVKLLDRQIKTVEHTTTLTAVGVLLGSEALPSVM